jgi:hypothetical protein
MRNSYVPARIVILLATVLAVAAGVCHLYMRFANNTQGEMLDGHGHVDLVYSALPFLQRSFRCLGSWQRAEQRFYRYGFL